MIHRRRTYQSVLNLEQGKGIRNPTERLSQASFPFQTGLGAERWYNGSTGTRYTLEMPEPVTDKWNNSMDCSGFHDGLPQGMDRGPWDL